MKRITVLILVMILTANLYAGDFLIVAIKVSASEHDKLAVNAMLNTMIDKDYDINKMGVTWLKKGPPNNEYLLGCWDVEGRKFPFKADNATAWINSHSADFDAPNDVVVLKQFTSNWGPKQ